MKKITLLFSLFFALQPLANAISFDKLWTRSNDKEVKAPGERKLFPQNYQLVKLNETAYKLFQSTIPMENTGTQAYLSLPTPDGGSMDFQIVEAPMMEEELARKYSDIKTYTAVSVQDPWITAKIDYTLFGFHAKVFAGDHTYFIDPYTNVNSDWYIVFYKNQYNKPLHHRMHCSVDEEHELIRPSEAINITGETTPQLSYKQNGTQKRTYRLALACTEEYSAAVGGPTPTKASVLSAMVTTMNRVNGVFEREFSWRLNIIANNDTLIFLPGSNDPYTNNNGSTMLGQNQTTVTNRIGSANYDIGHVFSTGGGGIAQLSSVCSNNNKARGVTGSPNPVGDPFDIDYVAHEMGHQYGGQHTFNSITGSCQGNRSGGSAFEIGSATTIMGYAGICGSDNIQNNSDDYYHIRSLEQMTGNGVLACAATTASNNQLPTLAPIKQTYIIPHNTPFEMTASGSDPDNNPLTYCWEQYDAGGNGGAWNAVSTLAPITRSFRPSTSPTRTVPQWRELIKNTESYKGEILPVNSRLLRFRCTLRDINNGYGAFYTSLDSIVLDVRQIPDSFRVTSQNSNGIEWMGGSQQTITWNVAGTDQAPFDATHVDIFVSTDSGKTWPHHMGVNLPNTGTATIFSPNENANFCRVKVKARGNVFFDLNNNWFKITQVNWPTALDNASQTSINIYPNPSQGNITVELPTHLQGATLRVHSLLGDQLWESSTTESKTNIQLPKFPKGVYTLSIHSDHQRIVHKLLID